MTSPRAAFTTFFEEPSHQECRLAHEILEAAAESASSFEHIYTSGHDSQDEDQDLLRAMLLFSSAGLDSMVKQLARDAMLRVIEGSPGAREQYRVFVERRLKNDRERFTVLSAALVGGAAHLQAELILDLTRRSLQSVDELSRTAAHFDIPTSDLIPDADRLRQVFEVRNQIAHEMDVDPSTGRQRRREFETMRADTEEVFAVAGRYLKLIDARVP